MMRFDEKALEGLPLPPHCPATGTCIRYEQPEPGLVVLVLDPPHRKLAVLDLPLMRDLSLAITRLEDDRARRGVVITGRAPLEFALGADIDAIGAIEDPALVERAKQTPRNFIEKITGSSEGERRNQSRKQDNSETLRKASETINGIGSGIADETSQILIENKEYKQKMEQKRSRGHSMSM